MLPDLLMNVGVVFISHTLWTDHLKPCIKFAVSVCHRTITPFMLPFFSYGNWFWPVCRCVSFSMCNEFSQIFQLCQFVMVCRCASPMALVILCGIVPPFIFMHIWLSTSCAALPLPGEFPECTLGPRNPGDLVTVPQLDSTGLHLWNQTH